MLIRIMNIKRDKSIQKGESLVEEKEEEKKEENLSSLENQNNKNEDENSTSNSLNNDNDSNELKIENISQKRWISSSLNIRKEPSANSEKSWTLQ